MSSRAELLGAIGAQMRLQSSLGLVLHQSVADRFGLNPTDLKCLDLAAREPDLTAGRIAELTAMSTSAVTALLDRLERRGFIERRRDPTDRRRVYVVSTGRHERELATIYAPLATATGAVLDSYSDDELRLLLGFLERLTAASRTFLAQEPEPS
ncbi:MarR family transcriptional regulator [Dactylosporangium aurantiacum]|uniref:MarR family transcriptional regulator n=1 Tax=Dactylosporangium aurantiacum TaxID=35754 RepID=A0A9Q9IIT5_9ACTN|nr:MarR family transcriptional regulator [Dactylosporangium aurantiacum]MDG6104088.1 MarR family transcriptional regulator [Dactylosporangium aurantiacum]UWZ56897.1 MarR family transcriptional regulator [Dactylosporangium aurantiacum]